MKWGRSIETVTCRSRNGTPWTIVGSGSDFTVTWACAIDVDAGADHDDAEVERAACPAVGTAIDSPNGASLYGPVR